MRAHMKRFLGVLLVAASLGHEASASRPQIEQVKVAADELALPLTYLPACNWSVEAVLDARPAGAAAGRLGANDYVFEDAPQVIRQTLSRIGFNEGSVGSHVLQISLLRLYLSEGWSAKLPVAVIKVEVQGQPAFLIRAQQSSIHWTSGVRAARTAYGQVLGNALSQMNARLDTICPAV